MSLAVATAVLGAPGIRVAPPEPVRQITGVRRDVAAFFGVAPRGPTHLPEPNLEVDTDVVAWLTTEPLRQTVPVPVSSWDEYRYHFGGFEGPGRLPYAVSAFFAQGGELAYVGRMAHDYGDREVDLEGRASRPLGALETTSGAAVRLFARSEGTWGDRLRSTLGFTTRPVAVVESTPSDIVVHPSEWVPIGSLIRLAQPADTYVLRYVTDSVSEPDPAGAGQRRRITLAMPVPVPPTAGDDFDVVTGTLETIDLDERFARREVLTDFGFHPDHPRSIARTIIEDSDLVWPDTTWAADPLDITDPLLAPVSGVLARGTLEPLVTEAGIPVRLVAIRDHAWESIRRVDATFVARPLTSLDAATTHVDLDGAEVIPLGSLVRLDVAGVLHLRFVTSSTEAPGPGGIGVRRRVSWAEPLSSPPTGVEEVTMRLELGAIDLAVEREEVFADIGMRPEHPRWLAAVLDSESMLVAADASWTSSPLVMADPTLAPLQVVFAESLGPRPGADRWNDIVPGDHWDTSWVPGDERVGGGVHSIVEHTDIGLLVAPDLYEPVPLAPPEDVTDPPTLCGPDFEVHVGLLPVVPSEPPAPGLAGLALSPSTPADLKLIVEAQQALVTYAEQRRDLTVLLDVPLGLTHRQVLTWRTAFDSAFAAAYHPWVDVAAPDDARDGLVRVNPSAHAAGIIAERERRLGVQHGPANELAIGPVRVADTVSADRHDELHPAGINVFLTERDGLRLTGARTLSRRSSLRQLSVARLMTVLRLSLEREMDWATFEPSNEELWAEVRRMVHGFLGRLYAAGAFRGATTKEAFFVRCDRTTMTRNDLDNGRMICLVGVAPAEPIEYLVLELARDRDTSVKVEVAG
ncbi:MAG: phage tail sheath subtilisin-like domain-containing protein [Acidimicrobiia bacterium]|nr:phage tail sheath subtilisin-like domain-containing protein [Acidimicrobiia bacterium]